MNDSPDAKLTPEAGRAAPTCASFASKLERLKKSGKVEGKEAFDADLKAGDACAFFCPSLPLVVRIMKEDGYDISDCEETIQAAFEFATACRDEYSRLYFRYYAP